MRYKAADKLGYRGAVKIILKDAESGETIKVIEKTNLLVDSGANLLRDFLKGDSVSGLTHMAIGTGTTAPAGTDTQLENETYRQTFTDIAFDNRMLKLTIFVSSSAYVGDVSEMGLFGNGATDDPNTGTLFARVTVPTFTKSSTETLTVEWTINL